MARLLRCVAVVALVGGATASLTACSGDPGPIVTETPSPTAVVSAPPSPSPTPTVIPEEELLAQIPEDARGEDFYSASQFAKFFVELYSQMMKDQDSQLFRLLSDDACVFCSNALSSLEELESSQGSITGGEITVQEELASGGLEADGTTNASFHAETAESTVLNTDGTVRMTTPGRSGRLGVSLRYQGNHWVVVGVGSEEA